MASTAAVLHARAKSDRGFQAERLVSRIILAGLFALAATPSLAQTPPIAAAPPPVLHLVCDGLSVFTAADGHPAGAEGQTLIDVTGPAGRIKLPAIQASLIHDQTDDGWRPLAGLAVTDSAITGQVSLGILDKPTVAIDRVTGHLDVKSAFGPVFGGECQTYDPAARKF